MDTMEPVLVSTNEGASLAGAAAEDTIRHDTISSRGVGGFDISLVSRREEDSTLAQKPSKDGLKSVQETSMSVEQNAILRDKYQRLSVERNSTEGKKRKGQHGGAQQEAVDVLQTFKIKPGLTFYTSPRAPTFGPTNVRIIDQSDREKRLICKDTVDATPIPHVALSFRTTTCKTDHQEQRFPNHQDSHQHLRRALRLTAPPVYVADPTVPDTLSSRSTHYATTVSHHRHRQRVKDQPLTLVARTKPNENPNPHYLQPSPLTCFGSEQNRRLEENQSARQSTGTIASVKELQITTSRLTPVPVPSSKTIKQRAANLYRISHAVDDAESDSGGYDRMASPTLLLYCNQNNLVRPVQHASYAMHTHACPHVNIISG
ncbi:uncharacterized protein BDR25DRAFT_358072 [Lindgomyces ingoldianus]|uniref:Uncharacterized protein n=1 Tax=Lindgomyces ingoldianus TaxID=673940 RepID=A0ACB6QNR2_9PLEO|nr:uncharacterized protein BDR25DRAFT_358072 [Lindgomyces ingoldianus]KAF2467796.1 hypothetical protein BDR25DRAFT_358072 [Lindgomyces ingoldianus]